MTVIDWLLDSDPAIRWQVLRDLADAPADVVAAERARIPSEGWGARLLDLEDDDGQWDGGALFPGADRSFPGSRSVRRGPAVECHRLQPHAAARFRDRPPTMTVFAVRSSLSRRTPHWEYAGRAVLRGRGRALHQRHGACSRRVLRRGRRRRGRPGCLVSNSRTAGGTARSRTARFVLLSHTTIRGTRRTALARACDRPLPGSVEGETAWRGVSPETEALPASEHRRSRRPRLVGSFRFPLAGTTTSCAAWSTSGTSEAPPDPRLDEAVDLLRSKRQSDGTWLLENTHPGKVWFALEAATAGRVNGTRCGLCVYCAGTNRST